MQKKIAIKTPTEATRHYHGTSLSIFQLLIEESHAIVVKYGDLEHPLNQSPLKVDALPSSYAYVKKFLTPLQTLTMPSKFPLTSFESPQTAITEMEYQAK